MFNLIRLSWKYIETVAVVRAVIRQSRCEAGASTAELSIAGAALSLFAIPIIVLLSTGNGGNEPEVVEPPRQIVGEERGPSRTLASSYEPTGTVMPTRDPRERPGAELGVGYDEDELARIEASRSVSRHGFLVRRDPADQLQRPGIEAVREAVGPVRPLTVAVAPKATREATSPDCVISLPTLRIAGHISVPQTDASSTDVAASDARPDCQPETTRYIVTAAPDQLGDGTIFAPVAITAVRDALPDQRAMAQVQQVRTYGHVGLLSERILRGSPQRAPRREQSVAAGASARVGAATFVTSTLNAKRPTQQRPSGSDLRDALVRSEAAAEGAPPTVLVARVTSQIWGSAGGVAGVRAIIAAAPLPPDAEPAPEPKRTLVPSDGASTITRSGR
ncbi:MAG: hypothetical protein AAGI50_13470 [Pseudomonadota bacterium]